MRHRAGHRFLPIRFSHPGDANCEPGPNYDDPVCFLTLRGEGDSNSILQPSFCSVKMWQMRRDKTHSYFFTSKNIREEGSSGWGSNYRHVQVGHGFWGTMSNCLRSKRTDTKVAQFVHEQTEVVVSVDSVYIGMLLTRLPAGASAAYQIS